MIFKFKLTNEQMKIVESEHDKAISEFKKGLSGSIICQIGMLKNRGKDLYVIGSFIPNFPALIVQGIISEVLKNESGME